MFFFSEFKRGASYFITLVAVDLSSSRRLILEAISRVIRDLSLFAISVTTIAILTSWVIENILSTPYLIALLFFVLLNFINIVAFIPYVKKKRLSVPMDKSASNIFHKRVVMVLAAFLSSFFHVCLVTFVSYFVGLLCFAFFVFVPFVFYFKIPKSKMLTRFFQNSLLLVYSLLFCVVALISEIGLSHSAVTPSGNEVIFIVIIIIFTRRCGQVSWSFGKQLYALGQLIKRKEFEAINYLVSLTYKAH